MGCFYYALSLFLFIISVHNNIAQHASSSNYKLNDIIKNNVQLICTPNCVVCNSSNLSQCQQCQIGYVLLIDFTCSRCNTGCAACQGQLSCLQCQVGYLMVSQGYLSNCLKCPQGCQTCSAMSIQTTFIVQTLNCSQCYPGFYKSLIQGYNSIYACSPCLPGCTLCTNSTSCSACISGFGYNSTANVCYVCQQNCLTCVPEQGCQKCTLGYFLTTNNKSESTCTQCLLNCIQCSTPLVCIRCAPGYYVSTQVNPTTNVSASICMSCQQPCRLCYNQNICLSCPVNYFLNITQHNQSNITSNTSVISIQSAVCQSCISNCAVCTSSNTCQKCSTNYFLNSNSICQSCGTACHQCISETQCLSCTGSFYLNNGICLPCSQNCSICQGVAVNNLLQEYCINCISVTFLPVNGQCVQCQTVIQGCLTCTPVGNCLTCTEGYDLMEGLCMQTYKGLGAVYIVLFCIAGIIGLIAIGFGIWACWRHRNGYGVMGGDQSNPGLRASYYQIP